MKKPQSSSCVVREAYNGRIERQTGYYSGREGMTGAMLHKKCTRSRIWYLFEAEGVGAAVVKVDFEDVFVCSSDPFHRVWSIREHPYSKGEQQLLAEIAVWLVSLQNTI